MQLYVQNAWTRRHLIQANRDAGTEFKHYMHKYVWSAICMNGYFICLQIGNNSMCRLNVYFAYNRQWIIPIGCNWMKVYWVIHCFGPCSAWYVYYFARPRYGSGCVWVSNSVSETVGSPWVSNHQVRYFQDRWSLHVTPYRVVLARKNTLLQIQKRKCFLPYNSLGSCEIQKGSPI